MTSTSGGDATSPATAGAPAVPGSVPGPVPVPQGWYADPHGAAALRWWDGNEWTSHISAAEPAPQFAASAPRRGLSSGAWIAVAAGGAVAVAALAALVVPRLIEVGEEVTEIASGEIITDEEADELSRDFGDQLDSLDWDAAVAEAPPAVEVAGGQSVFEPPTAWVEMPDTSAVEDEFALLGPLVEVPGMWVADDGNTMILVLGINVAASDADLEPMMEDGRAGFSPYGDATVDALSWTVDGSGRTVLLGELSAVVDGYEIFGTCALVRYEDWVVQVIASGTDANLASAAAHEVVAGTSDA